MKQIQAVVSHPLFLCALFCMTSAWDPDAGLVTSFTKTSQARVFASSNLADAVKANDGNDSTQWISHGCMPGEFYLYNELTNVLYQACQQGRCSSSSAGQCTSTRSKLSSLSSGLDDTTRPAHAVCIYRERDPTVTLTWHASNYKVYQIHQRYILKHIIKSLLLCLCDVFRALINSFVC